MPKQATSAKDAPLGDWKRDKDARAAFALDSVLMGPTKAAKKWGASKRTAQRLANQIRTPSTPEQVAEFQITSYQRLADIRRKTSSVVEAILDELIKDDFAKVRRAVLMAEGHEALQILTRSIHDLARSVEVTMMKVNPLIGMAKHERDNPGNEGAITIDSAPVEDIPPETPRYAVKKVG